MKCFHVKTKQGETYGVAATGKRDALQMTTERLVREAAERAEFEYKMLPDEVVSAEYVGTWTAEYGTVLWY